MSGRAEQISPSCSAGRTQQGRTYRVINHLFGRACLLVHSSIYGSGNQPADTAWARTEETRVSSARSMIILIFDQLLHHQLLANDAIQPVKPDASEQPLISRPYVCSVAFLRSQLVADLASCERADSVSSAFELCYESGSGSGSCSALTNSNISS